MSKKKIIPESQSQSPQSPQSPQSQSQSQSQQESLPKGILPPSALPSTNALPQEIPQLPEPEKVPKRRGRPPGGKKKEISSTILQPGGMLTLGTEGLWIVLGSIICSRLDAPNLTPEETKALGAATDVVAAKYLPSNFEYIAELSLASTIAAVFLPRIMGAQQRVKKSVQTIPSIDPLPPIFDEEEMTEETTIPFTNEAANWR